MSLPDEVPPHITSFLDQIKAGVRQLKGAALGHCAPVPAGCGKKIDLQHEFRDQLSACEYEITHLCQSCQDIVFAPSAEDVEYMVSHPRLFGRCVVCGEYREYEEVDVGVGIMRGFDCCQSLLPPDQWPPRCTQTRDCALCEGHAHTCTRREDSHP